MWVFLKDKYKKASQQNASIHGLYINDKLLSYGPATFYAKKWARVRRTQCIAWKIFQKVLFMTKECIQLSISSV